MGFEKSQQSTLEAEVKPFEPVAEAIIDFQKGNTAVRTKTWCYIRYGSEQRGEELYDHRFPNPF